MAQGADAPPILSPRRWLTLWHGVEPKEIVGIYRTYWTILDADDPSKILFTQTDPLIEANPDLRGMAKSLLPTVTAATTHSAQAELFVTPERFVTLT